MQAWTKLAWLVILDKKVAAELGEAILANAVSEKVATMCLSALGKAGTPAAQAALVGVLDSARLSSAVRSSAAIGMYGLQKPGKKVFAALSRQVGDMTALDEVRGSSLLAFGVLAGRSNEPLASGQTPIQHLLAMETKADRAAAAAAWLDALGNSSDPRTLDRVVAHLGHKDPQVRQSAVEALRGHDDPRAASAIERMARYDQDINVRVRAVQVLGMRNDRHAAITLARLARQEKSPVVRRAAIREISAIGHPDAKTLLAHSAQNDPDKGVREFAKMLLRSGG
jgi:HEAT repeat protein